jgi:serine protease Do
MLMLILGPGVQAQEMVKEAAGERAALQNLSRGFTSVAKSALPAVVSIKVEKAAGSGQGAGELNNPFDLFGEEFFERFFGRRFPEGRRPGGQRPRQLGQGSGFLISPDGHILTNNHVVGEADRVIVTLADGRELQAKPVGTDPRSDVAVIKIEGNNFPVLPLGDSDTLEVGEWVIALGNPFGLTQTMTVGVVSAKGRSQLGIVDYEDFIQTDAAINPGNSGGPLLNLQGAVVGLNTAIFSQSGGYMGIGFAIPINMAKAIEKQLIATGKVTRGYLGVRIQELSEDLARSFGVEGIAGVLVAEVTEGTPAVKAGIKAGDVILEIDGQPVRSPGQLRNVVAATPPGTTVRVLVLRDKKRHELSLKVGELPAEQVTASASEPEAQSLGKLGLGVQNLTDELAQQLGYERHEGVVVSRVEPDSAAARAGLRPGMLIRQVNQKDVENMRDFQTALAESERTQRVLLLVQDRQSTRYVALRFG